MFITTSIASREYLLKSGRTLGRAAWCVLAVIVWIAPTATAQVVPYLQWNFNNSSTSPSLNTIGGSPNAATVGLTGSASFPLTADGLSGDSTGNNTNRVWQTSGYPADGNASGSAGVEFTGVNTVGRPDMLFSFTLATPNGASRWYQLQYRAGTSGVFTDLSTPFQSVRVDNTTPWALDGTFNLAGVSALEGVNNLQLRVVSVFAPGTSNYQGVGTTYNPSTAVSFDLVTFAQSNRLSSTVGSSASLTANGIWSLGAPNSASLASNLSLGANTNNGASSVTLNVASPYSARSIVFRSDANKSYTFSGSSVILGFGGNDNYLGDTQTLVNASNQTHTFTSEVEYSSIQTWNSGATAGGRLVFNGGVAFSGSTGSNLNIIGSNRVDANAGIYSFGGAGTVTRSGGVLTVADSAFSSAGMNYVATSGGKIYALNNATNGSMTNGGTVVVNNGGLVGGTGRIAVASGTAITVNSGGTIRGGFAVADGGTGSQALGNLTVAGNVLVNGGAGTTGGRLAVDMNGTTNQASRVTTTGTGDMTFNTTNGKFRIALAGDQALQLNQAYSVVVASSAGGFKLQTASGTNTVTSFQFGTDFEIDSVNFNSFSNVSLTASGGNLTLQFSPLTPVPEPVLVGSMAALTVGGWLVRRRRSALAV